MKQRMCLLLAALLLAAPLTACRNTPAESPLDSHSGSDASVSADVSVSADASVTLDSADVPDTADSEEKPTHYNELRSVPPTAATPTLDGSITAEEWGDSPDFHLDAEITGGERTYCCDKYGGRGINIPDMDYFWRYDAVNIYLALRIREPEEYYTPADVTLLSTERCLVIELGEKTCKITPLTGAAIFSVDGVTVAYAEAEGVRSYEVSFSRTELGRNVTEFTGYMEYCVTTHYERHDNIAGNMQTVVTRNTPVFSDSTLTHDLFVLEEGTPAPPPDTQEPLFPEGTLTVLPTGAGEVETEGGFRLQLGEPVVVGRGEVGEFRWGYMQFPRLHRTEEGIFAMWEEGSDDYYYAAGLPRKFSDDGGATWQDATPADVPRTDLLMPNGKYFNDFPRFGSHTENYLNNHTPGVDYGSTKLYFLEDIKDDPAAAADVSLVAEEYDPVTGEITSFDVTVNWPYAPLVKLGDLVYPVQMMFALHTRSIIAVGDELYMPMYFYGFDSFATSREEAVMELSHKYSVYVFKSADSGRTWDLISQVYTDAYVQNYAEGVCEPEMTVMPDGSFVMLMRTGGNNPCYIVRSTDGGITWSKPQKFDDFGVLPQLVTLECGVTLASYGRPTMRLRATADPTGKTWLDPFTVPVTVSGQSCHYTDLLALDANTALLIYTDFQYPDEDGEPVKTVLVRTVKVLFD